MTRRALGQVENDYGTTKSFRTDVEAAGLPVPVVVGGPRPLFRFAPGTPRTSAAPAPHCSGIWLRGKFADLEFQQAAVLLSRVVSKPGSNRITLDLGHKGISAENLTHG